MKKEDNVPNQVFIGCPWKTVRPKYDSLIEEFKKKYPLSFVIVGRGSDQNAEDLLKIIREKLFTSSWAIFDASSGNANVSLEYGMAEVGEIPRSIYITKHRKARGLSSDSAIISDLAGKKRNEYKQLNGLRKIFGQFAQNHSYTKRFEKCLKEISRKKSKGMKRRVRSLTLKIIHCLDEKDAIRRTDIVQDLTGIGYEENEVNDCIKKLHHYKLIRCAEGRYSTVTIN